MIYDLEPLEKQDKLKENLLKTTNGNYVELTSSFYYVDGDEDYRSASYTQDKLEEGLIRFRNGSYYPLSSLRVEESECFIATAVYGDINAPQVQALRRFRDEVLEQDPLGRAFVRFYYSGSGEATSNFIRERIPVTILIIRKILDRLAESYQK